MNKHTPEPWSLHGDYINSRPFVVSGADEDYVAYSAVISTGKMIIGETSMCTARNSAYPRVVSSGETRANAQRIVDCVNACAGIPSEEICKIAHFFQVSK